MAPSLRPATDDELARLIVDQMEPYVRDRITAGEHPDDARRIAEEQIGGLFPDGRPAPGQLVFMIVDDGAVVGSLWIGPHASHNGQAFWVWNVEIAETHRGRGSGAPRCCWPRTRPGATGPRNWA